MVVPCRPYNIHTLFCDLNIKCQRILFNNKSYSSKITAKYTYNYACERRKKKLSRMKNEAEERKKKYKTGSGVGVLVLN